VLDVYGTTAHHSWLMRVWDGAESSSEGPMSSRAISGGVEYLFASTVLLEPPYVPVTVRGEEIIDSSRNPPVFQYTSIRYESGGVLITTKYCGS